MKIQRIMKAIDKEPRLETGVVQVDYDWPGMFFRGDDAVRMAHTIETVLEDSVTDKTLFTMMLSDYATLLKSCVVDNEDKTE